MALGTGVTKLGQSFRRYGITVLLVPTTNTANFALFDVELQRAPDSAGAPNVGSAAVIARLPPLALTGTPYTDVLPNDNTRRHYRWRFVRTGYSAGAWSSWLQNRAGTQGAKPVLIAAETNVGDVGLNRDKPLTDLNYVLKASDTAGKETDDDLWIASNKTAKVGTVASPGSIANVLRITHAELVPESEASTWKHTTYGGVHPNATGVSVFLYVPIVLPAGVTLTDFGLYGYRNAVGDKVEAKLYAQDLTGWPGGSVLATATHATTGWAAANASISTFIDDTFNLIAVVEIKSTSAITDAIFLHLGIGYTRPSYDKVY